MCTSIMVVCVQDEKPKPSQQFAMRFGTAMDKVSFPRNGKIFSKKTEKDRSYEGQRLPLSSLGMLMWVRIPFSRKKDVISHIEFFGGVSGKKNCVYLSSKNCQCCENNLMSLLRLAGVY